jgi:tetratricopeptide (TPR) repeat protein
VKAAYSAGQRHGGPAVTCALWFAAKLAASAMSGSGATTEPSGLPEHPRVGVGDVEAELGWRPLPDVPAHFQASVDTARVALAGFWRDREAGALEELVGTWGAVVEDPAFDESPVAFRRDVWNRLAIALNWRGVQDAKRSDLRAALDAWDRALGMADAGWSNYAACLCNMARTMLATFQLFGEADLDRAVELAEESVAAAPADDPVLTARCLMGGAATYASRHRMEGRPEDIDSAVAMSQRALEKARGWPPLIPSATEQLAQSLGQRYESFNDVDDLRRAISVAESVIDQAAHNLDSARLTSLLGSLLRQRWFLFRRPEDLDRAIELNEAALSMARGSGRPIRMTNVGNALLERWNLSRRIEDLERAADLHVRAVELSEPTDWQLAARLNNAGNSTLALARATNDDSTLERAIDYAERAVAATRPNAQELASRHYNLGQALVVAAESRAGRDLDERIRRAFRAACDTGLDRSLQWALEAARAWGRWAAGRCDWPEAATAYAFGVEALSRLFVGQLTRDDKETWIGEAASLPAEAVHALALAIRPQDAVATAERARAMMLSDALGRDRADLARIVADGRGDLAERFRTAAENWRLVAGTGVRPTTIDSSAPRGP